MVKLSGLAKKSIRATSITCRTSDETATYLCNHSLTNKKRKISSNHHMQLKSSTVVTTCTPIAPERHELRDVKVQKTTVWHNPYKKFLQNRIVALRAKVDGNMQKSQMKYKPNFDRRVRKTPSFSLGPYVLINNPTLGTLHNASVEFMSKHNYSTLQAWTRRLYQAISVRNNTLTIDDKGNLQIEATNRVAHSPSSLQRHLHPSNNGATQQTVPTRWTGNNREFTVSKNAYVAGTVRRHTGQPPDIKNIVP